MIVFTGAGDLGIAVDGSKVGVSDGAQEGGMEGEVDGWTAIQVLV